MHIVYLHSIKVTTQLSHVYNFGTSLSHLPFRQTQVHKKSRCVYTFISNTQFPTCKFLSRSSNKWWAFYFSQTIFAHSNLYVRLSHLPLTLTTCTFMHNTSHFSTFRTFKPVSPICRLFHLTSPIFYRLYKLLELTWTVCAPGLLMLYGLCARLAGKGSAASQDGRERVGWCSNSSDSSNSSNSL